MSASTREPTPAVMASERAELKACWVETRVWSAPTFVAIEVSDESVDSTVSALAPGALCGAVTSSPRILERLADWTACVMNAVTDGVLKNSCFPLYWNVIGLLPASVSL